MFLFEARINGKEIKVQVCVDEMLSEVLRNRLGLKGTKRGCEEAECGACTVLVDGNAILSCITPAAKVMHCDILTVEGLSGSEEDGLLHPIQRAFIEHGAFQCGFCTPGMLMSAKDLLDKNPLPTKEEVREGISGNLCRCTGYIKPIEAILDVARKEGAHNDNK